MKTIKERLTEGGASGAFFFFTKDERFIAKSCTTDEIAHIRRSAVLMAKYLEENPFSFITKVSGVCVGSSGDLTCVSWDADRYMGPTSCASTAHRFTSL